MIDHPPGDAVACAPAAPVRTAAAGAAPGSTAAVALAKTMIIRRIVVSPSPGTGEVSPVDRPGSTSQKAHNGSQNAHSAFQYGPLNRYSSVKAVLGGAFEGWCQRDLLPSSGAYRGRR